MEQRNLFDFVKGLLRSGPETPMAAAPPRPRPARVEPPAPRAADPDGENPATIARIGKSTDGRELIMTLGLGTFLVDREIPTICYYTQGAVSLVPTQELKHLYASLMAKRNVGEFALQYVDLLNVAHHEMEQRAKRRTAAGGKPPPPPPAPTPPPRQSARPGGGAPLWPDAENPATIIRLGRSHHNSELIMTLGLGTFVLHRDKPDLKYFDRGREWEIQEPDLNLLVEALASKQDMKEYQYAYVDMLNVATYIKERRRSKRR